MRPKIGARSLKLQWANSLGLQISEWNARFRKFEYSIWDIRMQYFSRDSVYTGDFPIGQAAQFIFPVFYINCQLCLYMYNITLSEFVLQYPQTCQYAHRRTPEKKPRTEWTRNRVREKYQTLWQGNYTTSRGTTERNLKKKTWNVVSIFPMTYLLCSLT